MAFAGAPLVLADYAWSGRKFAHATWLKVHMAREVLNMGFNILLSYTDVMWMKDPMPFIARFPEVDVLVSVDDTATATEANDAGLERVYSPERNHNTGVYFMRSKESSKWEEGTCGQWVLGRASRWRACD